MACFFCCCFFLPNKSSTKIYLKKKKSDHLNLERKKFMIEFLTKKNRISRLLNVQGLNFTFIKAEGVNIEV